MLPPANRLGWGRSGVRERETMAGKWIATAFAATLLAAPADAQSVKAGIEAWQRADYSGAVTIWRPLAEGGDADAMFNLGQADVIMPVVPRVHRS